jgi:hypothetical protein
VINGKSRNFRHFSSPVSAKLAGLFFLAGALVLGTLETKFF